MAIFNQSGMQAVTVVSLNVLNGAKRLNDWNGTGAWMLRAAPKFAFTDVLGLDDGPY
jgi:hypothetical protein